MRIVSKFRDYYDGVMTSLGYHDKSMVFIRKEVEVDIKDYPLFYDTGWRSTSPLLQISRYYLSSEGKKDYYAFNHFIIGFCGKLYLGFKFYSEVAENKNFPFNKLSNKKTKTTITYDIDVIKSILNISDMNLFNERVEAIRKMDFTDMFHELNTPIFVFDASTPNNFKGYNSSGGELIVNPSLKKYEFYRIFDSFQAYQEIEMYVGGVLGNNEDKTLKSTDKEKIISHGFDYKYSFRKDKKK